MLGITKWIVPPMIVGALMGTALKRGTAHACECSHEFWVIERDRVESTRSDVDDSQLWPAEGQLYPGSLSVWQEGHILNVDYRR
jgi:hypothetical protein